MNVLKTAMNESPVLRWSMMVLVSLAMFANYYFYDALSPLKGALQTRLGWTSANYGFFMSAYSIPNVFFAMAVIGGIILDKLGIRLTGFLFVVFMVIGSAITAYGASELFLNGGFGYRFMESIIPSFSPSLKMMSLGFLIFGLGAETSIVVFTKAVVKWFKGKELALALGLNLAFGRLGMAVAMFVSPSLEQNSDPWTIAIWFGTILLLIGFIAFIIYMFYDLKLDRQITVESGMDDTEKFRIKDLGKLFTNKSFIFITLLCVTFYSAVFPFVKYAPDLLSNKFGLDQELAGRITSILPFGTILFTPLFGTFTDNRGKSATLMVYGSVLLIIVHLMFALTSITPYVPMFLLGVAFSLIPAAMWPSVAKIVPEHRLGSAYGLMFSIQNLGLWAFPILIGKVLDISNPEVTPETLAAGTAVYDYTNPILMLTLLGAFGVLFAILLKREDKVSGFGLELPNKE